MNVPRTAAWEVWRINVVYWVTGSNDEAAVTCSRSSVELHGEVVAEGVVDWKSGSTGSTAQQHTAVAINLRAGRNVRGCVAPNWRTTRLRCVDVERRIACAVTEVYSALSVSSKRHSREQADQ